MASLILWEIGNMKVSDFVHLMYRMRDTRSDIFRVRIFVNKKFKVYVLISDLNDMRIGTSITNIIEDIHGELISKGLVKKDSSIIEHYENSFFKHQSFDLVSHGNNQKTRWRKLSIDEVCNILDCGFEEFHIQSLSLQHIYDCVVKLRHKIDPYLDEPLQESSAVLLRREQINLNSVSKDDLMESISYGINETKVHKIIKSDLSILGDYFSKPDEEYICFSEFPLQGKEKNGFVDFVVFSGRSRMDVTLIEIKGADFNLITKGNYKNFSAKANEGVQQLRDRTSCIYRAEEYFRSLFHRIRKEVESGKTLYGSCVGPRGKLMVDPNKDINIHRVFIGGRSVDDIVESRLRHEYERGQSPSIKIESWDSFIKKLDRK